MSDVRGPVVRSVGKPQTFLKAAQVDELVADYAAGLSIVELGRKFGIHHRTAKAHLVRRKVRLRTRGLDAKHHAEAVRLYECGLTLMEVGLQFGVSQDAVRRVVADAGVTIRPRGHRPGNRSVNQLS
jgi:hypothetical protein